MGWDEIMARVRLPPFVISPFLMKTKENTPILWEQFAYQCRQKMDREISILHLSGKTLR